MINKEKNNYLAITISKPTYKLLDEVSKQSGLTKSKVIETILVSYFNEIIEEINKKEPTEKKGA